MKIKSILLAAALGASALGLATPASASVLFADNFQGGLGQWGSNYSGHITAAPGGGNALAFNATIGGGDIFAANSVSSVDGWYHLSFDYLGTCARGQSCGGFVGYNNPGELWLAGSGPYGNPFPITETGSWQTIAFDFYSAAPITLKLEDWAGGSDGGAPNNAYFRNLVLSDSAGVPEPASWTLMIAGFGLVGGAMRRRTFVAA